MAGRVTVNAGANPVVVTGLDATNGTPAYANEGLTDRVHLPLTIPAGAARILYTADTASLTPTVTDPAGNVLSAQTVPCRSGLPVTLGPFSVATSSGVSIANSAATPNANAGGGVLYVQAGALWFRGSSGTTTKLANA